MGGGCVIIIGLEAENAGAFGTFGCFTPGRRCGPCWSWPGIMALATAAELGPLGEDFAPDPTPCLAPEAVWLPTAPPGLAVPPMPPVLETS
jgi:hypothetical protein